MRNALALLTAAALSVALLHPAAATDTDEMPSMFTLGGFGTFGLVHSSRHDADFTSTAFKPNGAGYSHNWSNDVDSLFALQVTANLTPQLSAVLQVIAEQNYNNTYQPSVEWANIKYEFTDDFSARIGRTPLPAFMVADSRKLGYANPWVRPPLEVYSLVPVARNDGIDASYRWVAGAGTDTITAMAGRSDSDFPIGGNYSGAVHGRRQLVLINLYEQGFATVRINYSRARVTIDGLDPLLDGFREFGDQGATIASTYSDADRPVTFYGIGASYDPRDWFLMGEWAHIRGGPLSGDNTGWYATGGYRIGTFTPYATYARATTSSAMHVAGLSTGGLPPAAAAAGTQLNAALNSILESMPVQRTISVGTRWDFVKNVALKLQLDHTRIGAGSSAGLREVQPDFQLGGTLNVITATIDFVF